MKTLIKPERLFATFETLLNINSPAKEEHAIATKIREILKDLPLTEIKLIAKDNQPTLNMLFKLPAHQKTQEPVLLLSAHLDTVEPTENIQIVQENEEFRSNGKTILGADDKSGLAIIIETLFALHENQLPHPPIEILFTEQEEIGLLGSKRLDAGQLEATQGLILDADGPAGLITHAAPFQINFQLDIHGIPAHAGAEPEKGKSAIKAAATLIQSLPFGRIDEDSTLNIGKIEGGKASNIVTALCHLEGEIRSLSRNKLELLGAYLEKKSFELQESSYRVDFKKALTYHGYYQEIDTPFLQKLKTTALSIGLEPIFKKSGGGSDANVLKGLLPDLECVVLSTGMQKVHTHQEFIAKKDLQATAEWLLAFICSDHALQS